MFSFGGKRFVILIAALFLLAVPAGASAASSTGPVRPCNGSAELCSLSFNQVVLPGSHNSMSAAELNWFRPNQTYSIPHQLERGARALLFDTYYAKPRKLASGEIVLDKLSRTEGSQTGADMYLCHENCQWGNSRLIDVFRQISDFLAKHPREAMVFVNQDDVTPVDYAKAVEQSGLIKYIYRGPTDTWPTLGQMVDSDQRVVMLAEQQADGVPWYHEGYDGPMQETPYSFPSWASLYVQAKLDYSCRPNRGNTTGALFLMNNWVTDGLIPPKVSDALLVNSKRSLVARAEACLIRRGVMPTILAVDFFGTGDVVGAARELNGVEPAPFLEISSSQAVSTRAGSTAIVRIKVANYGDSAATGLLLCSFAPANLARRKLCRNIGVLQPGSSRMTKLGLRTRPKVRGRGSVKVTLSTPSGRLDSKTKLTVKPARKARHR